MKTAPLISLQVLCYDVFAITLDKQATLVQNNAQQIIEVTRNKQTVMWEVPLDTTIRNCGK